MHDWLGRLEIDFRGGILERRYVVGPLLLDVANGCALCDGLCVYDAIRVVDGKAVLDDARCEMCGLCITRCRPGALMWAQMEASR